MSLWFLSASSSEFIDYFVLILCLLRSNFDSPNSLSLSRLSFFSACLALAFRNLKKQHVNAMMIEIMRMQPTTMPIKFKFSSKKVFFSSTCVISTLVSFSVVVSVFSLDPDPDSLLLFSSSVSSSPVLESISSGFFLL